MNQSIFYTTRRRKGRIGRRESRLVWRLKVKDVSVFALLWFFMRPVRWPWFGAWLFRWFLGRPGTRPPGSFWCARWGRSGWTNMTFLINKENCKITRHLALMAKQIVLPLWRLFVAGSRGIFMGRAGWCVFRIWAIGAFWSFRPLWAWWRWTASSAATPRGAGWPTVTPLPVNRRGQISVRYYTNPLFDAAHHGWTRHDAANFQLLISPLLPGWRVLLLLFLLQVF